jgi:hypothetical protein
MAKFDSAPDAHIIVRNIIFKGNDLDAVFLKPSGIAVIEMKGHGGKVTFHESTPCKVGNTRSRGKALRERLKAKC